MHFLDQYILEMNNIHKHFPGVYALRGASLNLKSGEVMALVGENGAGKSTIINILGGIYSLDEGQILIDGSDAHITDVISARNKGISIIHQELVLVPYLTVAENIFINREPLNGIFVNKAQMFEKAQEYIKKFGMNISAYDRISDLTIAQQQMVEIIKAVSFQSRIIVMDEPTSSLSDKEIEALFDSVRVLKKQGIGIIYISHRLSELPEIADRVTVLRDGQTVGTFNVNEVSNDEIVHLMVGREIVNYYTLSKHTFGDVVLEADHITTSKVKDISFSLRKGEILGFSGLIGAGRTETAEAIMGFDRIISGNLNINGKKVSFRSPSEAYGMGIGYIPEDRRNESLFGIQPVRFNLTIRVLRNFIRGIQVNNEYEQKLADDYIRELSIKTSSKETMIQNLSGGNQQKVIIARWLAANPSVLIMDEPTRGIDVGAKAEIYELMNNLAMKGIAIVMISSELPEIVNMSDRVVVMREGRISKILDHDEISQDEIMKYAVNI